MSNPSIVWDLEDDLNGNYWHIVVEGHGITRDEVEEVLSNPMNPLSSSHSSGRPIAFGWTSLGQHIAVIFEELCDDPLMLYPVTAYVTPPRGGN